MHFPFLPKVVVALRQPRLRLADSKLATRADHCAVGPGATRRSATSSTTAFHAPRNRVTCAAPRVRLALCQFLLISICAGLTGCTSIYHRTWDKFPPEADEELAMRVSEARATARLGHEAVARLSADLDREVSPETIQVDFDRIEMLALELQRHLLSARDVMPQTRPAPSLAAEMDRLQQRSEEWLRFIHAHRHADAATQAGQIRALLSAGDAKSAAPAR